MMLRPLNTDSVVNFITTSVYIPLFCDGEGIVFTFSHHTVYQNGSEHDRSDSQW